jgi:hypothetical protein
MRGIVNWRRGNAANKGEERLDEAFNRGGHRHKRPVTLPKLKFTDHEEDRDDDDDKRKRSV